MKRVLFLIVAVSLALSAGSAEANDPPSPGFPIPFGWTWEYFWVTMVDYNKDCMVDIDDAQAADYRWATYHGDILYDMFFDTWPRNNPDFQISIEDVQTVFGRWDFTCAMARDPKDFMGLYSLTGGSEQA